MPKPHHRKKRKHFQPPPHKEQSGKSGSAGSILAIAGAVIGFIIAWLAGASNLVWMIIGLVAGATAGYFLGRYMDHAGEKKA